jgi:ParB family chromosome partitioning protein
MAKEAFKAKKGTFFWFAPEELKIVTDKKEALYDPRSKWPTDLDLVANILYKGQGILEPVVITKVDDQPVVIDGRQRVKAALEANKQLRDQGLKTLMVPCVYKRGNEESLYAMMVSANEQRKDDSDLEKAEKVQTMLNFGGTKEEAATVFGVTKQTITNWLELLELDPDVQKDVRDGKTKPTAARKTAKSRLPKKEKRQAARDASDKPRMRKRKEIEAKLAEVQGDVSDPVYSAGVELVLLWVLNEREKI